MGALAQASGGMHRDVSGAEEASQAARDLASENGNLLVTSFNIASHRPVGGEEQVSVTFASGGELICRGEGCVVLSPAADGDAPGSEPTPPPAPQAPANAEKPAVSPSGSSDAGSSGLSAAAIIGVAAITAILMILLLCVLRRKKSAAPNTQERPAAPAEPTPLPGIYLRLDVPAGIAVRGELERELTGEITLGNRFDCDVALGKADDPDWLLRIALSDGAIWCSPVSGAVSVNGEPIGSPRKMRSGDTVSCGACSLRLMF